MSVLIRGGRIVTAADDYVADLYVEDETISLIGESLDVQADRVIDASGKYVLPGCVDPHTHLDMPFGGTVTIDDVEAGQTAAAFGGREDVMSVLPDKVSHGGTYAGNRVAAAAAVKTLEIIRDTDALETVHGIGRRVQDGLREVLNPTGLPYHFTGHPCMFGIMFSEVEASEYRDWAMTDHELYDAIAVGMHARGAMPEPDSREPWFFCEAHAQGDIVDRVVSIFACGLIIMVTNGRLIFSMARDRRLPGHQLLHQVPRATGGPPWATIMAAVLGGIITLVLRTHTAALATLFTASTIMPALLYTGTVLLYVLTSRRRSRNGEGGVTPRPFGRWELPIVAGALIWLAYELLSLIGPEEFRDAQYYVLGALAVGLVFYVVQLLTEREAMSSEPGQE